VLDVCSDTLVEVADVELAITLWLDARLEVMGPTLRLVVPDVVGSTLRLVVLEVVG